MENEFNNTGLAYFHSNFLSHGKRNANITDLHLIRQLYRVSIKSFSDYKHLLQENYFTWNKNIYIYIYLNCNSRSFFFLQHIIPLQHVLLLLHGERPIDNQFISTFSPTCVQFSVNKNPTDATVCRYLFTAKSPYMFRVSQHQPSGVLKTVPAASGTGHNTGAATPLQRGLIGPDQTTLEGSSGTSNMTCTGGCGYSFYYS